MIWDPSATGEAVERLFGSQSEGRATIVAPFVKEGALRRLCASVGQPVDLYTRWLPFEIASGISDLEAFDVIHDTGGQVYLHSRIHAKAYIKGSKALAGSSNVTGNGLGFRSPSAVELLVPVDLPCPPVDALIEYLTRTASTATEEDRDAIQQRADQLDGVPTPQVDESMSYPDDLAASPLISFRDPAVAWATYRDPVPGDTTHDALLSTLAGLGVQPGIHDEQTFVAEIGAAMRQGIAGRVLHECRRLPGFAAVDRFRSIMHDAGVEVPQSQADRQWRTFCYWAREFVPEIELRPNQVGF